MKNLYELSKRKIFTDGKIETNDGKTFEVHRNVLTAASPYFKALFSNCLHSDFASNHVCFPDISSKELEVILQFIYTGTFPPIPIQLFPNVLRVIDRLGISPALQLCHQFMCDAISLENVVYIYNLAKTYYAPDAMQKAKFFILHNFVQVYNNSPTYICSLSFEDFKNFIANDNLNIRREEHTFQAIDTWVKFDVSRQKYFSTLIQLVRFGNSQLTFITDEIMKHELVQTNPETHSYLNHVDSVLRDIFAKPCPDKFNVVKHPFLRPRIPKDIVFAFGGWSASNATNIIETYDCRVNKWYCLESPAPFQAGPLRAYHGMVYLEKQRLIYVIGGFDGRYHFNTLQAFDPVTKIWYDKSCMHLARCYVSVALLNDEIYAMVRRLN